MYTVLVTPEAQADILSLTASIQRRLLDKLEWIGENAEFLRHEAMQGNDWPDCCRYRFGSYRIIYRLEHSEHILRVLKVGHRRDVYR
jgi:mRNA interferase RelE/StbE